MGKKVAQTSYFKKIARKYSIFCPFCQPCFSFSVPISDDTFFTAKFSDSLRARINIVIFCSLSDISTYMVCICRTMISEVHYKVKKSSKKDTKLNPAEKNRARIFRFSQTKIYRHLKAMLMSLW